MVNVGWWADGSAVMIGRGRRFGAAWWRSQSIELPIEERTRHFYAVGGSGSGKSRLARLVIASDARSNRGLALIDAQDLVREVLWLLAELSLPGAITPERVDKLGDKLVIVEPGFRDYGFPAFNFLQLRDGQLPYELVDSLIQLLGDLWPDSMGERLRDISRNLLLLLVEHRLTLAEASLVLSDAAVRQALVDQSRNTEVKVFFNEHLGGLNPRDVKLWFESSRNKWACFDSPFIRPLVGQRQSTIDFRAVLDQGQILLINLSRQRMKQESRSVLGGLLIHALHQAAISRENTPPEERYFFPIFIDEWQDYFCHSILEILEAGRKYGLSLNLFHQTMEQPPFDTNPGIIGTVLGNCHTRVCFSVSRRDAERLAAEFFASSATEVKFQNTLLGWPLQRPTCWSLNEERENQILELMHQQASEAYVSFKGLRNTPHPYQTRIAHVPDISPNEEKVDAVRRHVAGRYYRSAQQVEREIQERHARLRAMAQGRPFGQRDFRQ
ncbi:MAG: type IV secretory system conjugative DNA transfer family protein [Pirellulaceae bacterium]